MIGAKPYASPCISGNQQSKFDGDPLSDPTPYHHIVGALQYCTLKRPDIAFTVNQLCQFLHAPTTTRMTAAKRVLRYLKGTLDHGFYYTNGSLQLNAFCDADWAGAPDDRDRRSTTGIGVFLGHCLISWIAKKQAVVSRSSTEAEYRSMAIATADLYWLRMLFHDLCIPLTSTPVLWCDNIGALALASDPVFHARTKHIEIDYHFIWEKIINKDVHAKYISTAGQVVDIFTKGLTSARFLLLPNKLMVLSPSMCLKGAVNQDMAIVTPAKENVGTTSFLGNRKDHSSSQKLKSHTHRKQQVCFYSKDLINFV